MYIFAKSFQSDGWVQAILNIAFMVILFTVGWTLADLFVGLIVSDQGYILNIKPNSILNNILNNLYINFIFNIFVLILK